MKFPTITKRQKFVLSVLFLSIIFFVSQFLSRGSLVVFVIVASVITVGFFYLSMFADLKGTFSLPIFILPFLYTVSFGLFYLLIPSRFLSRFILTLFYGLGLYSLYLTQNIFAVSSIRTINLLRSARIISFILTIIVLFFLLNVTFSFYLPFYVLALLVFVVVFLLSFQLFWNYSLDLSMLREILIYSFANSLVIGELSIILTVWPASKTVYSIFLVGMFYVYSGLSHFWLERRLFKGILWEYVWVGFLSILILLFFSRWGI